MKYKNISRREFIKDTAQVTAAMTVGSKVIFAQSSSKYNAKGLPTTVLGKTGVTVPRIAIGTGSRYMAVQDEDKAMEILNHALDNGLYYWDTASTYRRDELYSEQRLGKILKDRRKEVFLATKVQEREPEEAKKIIERSFNRLQTDYIDIFQIHNIQSVDDVKKATEKGGVFDILRKYKEQGSIGNIGFTGHTSAEAMKFAAVNFDFDTMLIALNHYQPGKQKFEEEAVPAAAKKGLGVMIIKVIRPRETVQGIESRDLVRYALSLPEVNVAVIGTDSMEVLKANISILKNFKKMDAEEMQKMRMALAPVYRHERLVWMQPGYEDGHFV
jgi:aryl-alcohol dehydrogenase-like predicted oxidoreductase